MRLRFPTTLRGSSYRWSDEYHVVKMVKAATRIARDGHHCAGPEIVELHSFCICGDDILAAIA